MKEALNIYRRQLDEIRESGTYKDERVIVTPQKSRIDTTAADGVLDTKHYSDEIHRSWVFRSVGYGNDMQYWRDLISNLRLVGYDRVLSIEHEDSLMSIDEGLAKAVSFLKDAIIREPKPGTMGWA